jgi:hypothetical protein
MKNQPTGDGDRQLHPAKHFDDKYWIDLVRGLNLTTRPRCSSISRLAAKYAVEIATYGYLWSIWAGTIAFMNHPRRLSNR